jgi:DNA-binding CsgD family transcriptional regulator
VSQRALSFVVIHPEAIAADGIALALAQFPGLVLAGTGRSATEGLRFEDRADAVVMHGGLDGATVCARRLRARGLRVIMISQSGGSDGPEPHVRPDASIRDLAAQLLPGASLPDERLATLTPRERQILSLVSDGLAGKQVARVLGISPKTVERHKTRIYSKLGVPNQAAAAGLAARAYQRQEEEVTWNRLSI